MTNFVGIEELTPAAASGVPTGSIAYHTRDKQWMLHALIDEQRVLVALTGDRAPAIYRSEAFGDETAVVITDWRIEVDPNTCVEGTWGAKNGHAFLHGGISGFYANWVSARFTSQAIGFTGDGTPSRHQSGEATAMARRWRIVAGDAQDPFVICEFEQVEDE